MFSWSLRTYGHFSEANAFVSTIPITCYSSLPLSLLGNLLFILQGSPETFFLIEAFPDSIPALRSPITTLTTLGSEDKCALPHWTGTPMRAGPRAVLVTATSLVPLSPE